MFLRESIMLSDRLYEDSEADVEHLVKESLQRNLAAQLAKHMAGHIKVRNQVDGSRVYYVDVFTAFNKEQLKAALEHVDEDDLMDEIVRRFGDDA